MRHWTSAVVCAVLLQAQQAQAVLGGGEDSVHADQVRFQGEHRKLSGSQMTTHEIGLPDGSVVKEYINAAGLVFAVSWRTRLKPNLDALLGAHNAAPAASLHADSGVATAKRQQSMRQSNLVIHQGGRMNAFAGLAYVPSLVPEGFNADALR